MHSEVQDFRRCENSYTRALSQAPVRDLIEKLLAARSAEQVAPKKQQINGWELAAERVVGRKPKNKQSARRDIPARGKCDELDPGLKQAAEQPGEQRGVSGRLGDFQEVEREPEQQGGGLPHRAADRLGRRLRLRGPQECQVLDRPPQGHAQGLDPLLRKQLMIFKIIYDNM